MCLAIPARVVSVEGSSATVELRGNRLVARSDLVPVRPGDFVVTYAGLIVQVLDRKDAEERLRTLERLETEADAPRA